SKILFPLAPPTRLPIFNRWMETSPHHYLSPRQGADRHKAPTLHPHVPLSLLPVPQTGWHGYYPFIEGWRNTTAARGRKNWGYPSPQQGTAVPCTPAVPDETHARTLYQTDAREAYFTL